MDQLPAAIKAKDYQIARKFIFSLRADKKKLVGVICQLCSEKRLESIQGNENKQLTELINYTLTLFNF